MHHLHTNKRWDTSKIQGVDRVKRWDTSKIQGWRGLRGGTPAKYRGGQV